MDRPPPERQAGRSSRGAAPTAAHPYLRPSGTRRLWRLAHVVGLVLVLVIAAVTLAPRVSGARRTLSSLSDVGPLWLAAALIAELASLVAFSLATRALLEPGETRPSLWRILRIDEATIALSHVVPAGSAAGTALGYRLLTTAGVRPVESGFAKVSQSLLAGVVLQLLLWFSLALSIPLHGSSPGYLAATVVGAFVIASLVAAGVLLSRHTAAVERWSIRLVTRIPRVREEAVGRAVVGVADQLNLLLRSPRRLVWATVWSAANWVFDAFCLWACLRALGYSAPFDLLMVTYAVAGVLASLPITPSGLGLVEGALVPTLIGFGSPASVALLGVLGWRLFNFWLPLPLGLAAYLSLPHRRHDPARGELPAGGEALAGTDRPAREDRPTREDRPARGRPAGEDRPARGRPAGEDRPARGRPAREDTPVRGMLPALAGFPDRSTLRSGSASPSGRAPAESESSAGGGPPANGDPASGGDSMPARPYFGPCIAARAAR